MRRAAQMLRCRAMPATARPASMPCTRAGAVAMSGAASRATVRVHCASMSCACRAPQSFLRRWLPARAVLPTRHSAHADGPQLQAPRLAAPAAPLLARAAGFSTAPPAGQQQPGLTMEMALSISNATHMQLDKGLQGAHLDQIRTARAGVALSIRWQEMLNVYLSTLINNIVPLGFTADQHGLIAYNHHFTGLMSNNANPQTDELKEMHKNIWQTLLRKAFEVDFHEGIELNRAREIQGGLAYKLQSPDFLAKVDALAAGWRENPSVSKEEQHSVLLGIILDGQMEVMPEFGYEGEAGYVQLQAQLMEHANDPIIMNNTTAATMTVFERAGISLQ